MKIDTFDLTIILCNILDNAIEATKKLEAEKKINILLLYDRRRLILFVENTYTGIINMKKGNLYTSKTDVQLHGIGLENVKIVVQKYNGVVDIDYDNIWFKVYLMIYV